MTRLLTSLLILLTFSPLSLGQGGTTTVTAIVKDPVGALYINSQINITFYNPQTNSKIPLLNGSTFQTSYGVFGTDSFAKFTIALPDNGVIDGSSGTVNTGWTFNVCYLNRFTCFFLSTPINCSLNIPNTCTNNTMDISAALQAVAALIPGGTPSGGGTIGPCSLINSLAKFLTSTTAGCSTVTDDGTTPTLATNGLSSGNSGYHRFVIVDNGGVYQNGLVCRSNINKGQTCAAGTVAGVLGVARTTGVSGSTVELCWAAFCTPITDSGGATTGHWLIPSPTVAGAVFDTGSTSIPQTGTQTFLNEATVTGGNTTITNILSPDTLNATATGGSNISPALQFALGYYIAPGTGNAIGGIATVPTLNNGYFLCGYLPTGVAVAPNCNQVGAKPRALASSDTIAVGDIAGIAEWTGIGTSTVTVPDIGATGFAASPFFKVINGPGIITFNRTSTSLFRVSNGANPPVPVTSFSIGVGSWANFQKDADGTDWAVTTPTPVQTSFSPVPNVNVINFTPYTVLNSDNLWDDKITANANSIVNLPQAGTISVAPLVASRVSGLTNCTTCTTASFSQTSGNRLLISLYWTGTGGVGTTLNSFSDSAGDTCSRIQPDILIGGGTSVGLIQCTNIVTAAANTIQYVFSGSNSVVDSGIAEYTTTVTDQSGETSTTSPTATINLTIPVFNANELAFISGAGFAETCPSGWVQRGTPGNGAVFCDRLISSQPSVSGQLTSTGNNGGAVIIMADFGISGVVGFTAGWEFYVSNATPACSTVQVTPQGTSRINTPLLSGLTTFFVPCGMTARFRSDGTNYEMFQLTGTDGQPLSATYTNATTSFTSTALTFPIQANEVKSGSCHLTFQGTATTAAPIIQFTGPSAPLTVTANVTETLTSGSSPTFYSASTTGSTFALGLGATAIVSTATDMPMQIDFGIVNGGNAGLVTLQAKSNGAGTITFEKGSTCVLY